MKPKRVDAVVLECLPLGPPGIRERALVEAVQRRIHLRPRCVRKALARLMGRARVVSKHRLNRGLVTPTWWRPYF